MIKIDDAELLEPLKLYNSRLKAAFHDNSEEMFEELTKKAGVDIGSNRVTVAKHDELVTKMEKLEKSNKGSKFLRTFLVIISLALIFVGAVMIAIYATNEPKPGAGVLVLGIVFPIVGIGLILLDVLVIGKNIKKITQQISELEIEIKKLKDEAYSQMAILNSLFEWNMASQLLTKTLPLIQMDQIFDTKKMELLQKKYGFDDDNSTDTSAINVQSGSILGNPFLIEENYCQTMRDEIYHGTLVVTYNSTEIIDGKPHSISKTETLHATYTAPKPYYYTSTWLIYGSEAAPHLSFSRVPSGAKSMNEKELSKLIKNTEKDLDKMMEKSISKGDGNFVRMQNTEFEALFRAFDRDDNVEFRLLFTPLAQQNLTSLLKSKEPYGDDFIFKKRKCLNYIKSEHSQIPSLYVSSPNNFMDFSYERCRNHFVNYFDNFLKSFYFDLIPILSVPLYTQTKSHEYIYKDSYKGNITSYEVESSANEYNKSVFTPEGSRTDVILKSEFVKKVNNGDLVNIHSYAFKGEDRVALIPVRAMNGHVYDVPVNWVEYYPIDKITPFVVQSTNADLSTFRNSEALQNASSNISENGISYKKGFVSYVPLGNGLLPNEIIDQLKSN